MKSRIAPSKHHLRASNDPPLQLTGSQHIARITKVHGNSLYTVEIRLYVTLLVELPPRFRNAVWVRRGGYVLVDTEGYTEGKVNGQIVDVVRDERAWRKMSYWRVSYASLLMLGPSTYIGKKGLRTKTQYQNK